MDKHVIHTHEAENICLEVDAAFFSPRNVVVPTLMVGTTRAGKTRLREDFCVRPINHQEGV